MDAETKNYVDAKMETVKAQNDARFAEVLTSVKSIGDQIRTQSEIAQGRFAKLQADVKDSTEASKEAKSAAINTRWHLLATGVGVGALMLASFALWNQAVEMTTGILGAKDVEVSAPSD